MDPRKMATDTWTAHLVAPAIMAYSMSSYVNVSSIVHLGCGAIAASDLAVLVKHNPQIQRVYLYDPDLEWNPDSSLADSQGLRLPEVRINEEPPVGTPAIAMHPGFGMTEWEVRSLVKKYKEPWLTTLQRLKPSVVALSCYSDNELVTELVYLMENTKLLFANAIDTAGTRPYKWNNSSGPAFAMAIAIDQEQVVAYERFLREGVLSTAVPSNSTSTPMP